MSPNAGRPRPRRRPGAPAAKTRTASNPEAIVVGRRATAEAIRAGLAREVLLVPGARSTQGLNEAMAAADLAALPVRHVGREVLDGIGPGHQGVGARVRLQRDFQRAQVDFQRASEDAQNALQEAQQETSQAFSAKLFPIIGEVAREKKIWAVFGNDSGLLWHDPATDLSEEVAKRLDASIRR